MTKSERACQIWAVLALAASNRQEITYGTLAKLIGVPTVGLGQLLEPIQSYCLIHELPPLTLLVVKEKNRVPGSGFTAASAEEYELELLRIFRFDWAQHGNPQANNLQQAVEQRPSIGV